MKFGTGSTTELTQKREGQSTKMPYVRPYIYTNKLVVCLSTNGERALNYTVVIQTTKIKLSC